MKPTVTAADKAKASRLVEELETSGKLGDPRKALLTTLAQSFATIRALSARKETAAKGERIELPDGGVVRVEKSEAVLAIHYTEPGRPERTLISLSKPKVRAA